MTATVGHSRWLPFPDTEGGLRLYCLPHAGGSASAFRPWIGRIPGVSVLPVQYPGRETRLRETPHVDIPSLASELAEALLADAQDAPYAVYGHSFGALTAFEVLHVIRGLGGPMPSHLIVSGFSAPQSEDFADDAVTDEEIIALLRDLGGTPEQYLTDRRILKMIMPPLRADLTAKVAYRYMPRPELDVPILALGGIEDQQATYDSMRGWADQTTAGFGLHPLNGGHFAVLEQPEETLRVIAGALRRS
ncbi:thioesterase II family protein [Kutzneria sp. 744]|uniref:thioesterase II family protein n=1 Tax=Kutzneria sp. (strain 744) TaxID=345341 RepID=UPI0003EED925|nr:alpha/beta fold hydrolase [Kutzneria sp. 744]EWM18235.1 linear gramicidin dehydrogenase LgrE [Kutzneria sp. 744]